MPRPLITILGKTVKKVARMRGGGSALPGLVVERIDPNFIKDALSKLPFGTVVVSGTNGKTTTTKMIVELLESQGLKVFTNRTGSNFTRGVAAALLGDIDIFGRLHADIAVLELDEAYAVQFAKKVPPRFCLLLNVMRDQMDRFGEIDHTAKLLAELAKMTTDTIVLNREDARIASISKLLKGKKIKFFGLDSNLRSLFPADDELHSKAKQTDSAINADVILSSLDNNNAIFEFAGKKYETTLKLSGVYNVFNAAAALAVVSAIIPDKLDEQKIFEKLSQITPAFGRGEQLTIDGKNLEIVLVKNPSGFQLSLKSFDPTNYQTMIAINDNYADGRDMSWLWDVDFSSLCENDVAEVSGIRAYDMALRLQYDDVKARGVDTNLKRAVKKFLASSNGKQKRIYCTYTAMLTIRRVLTKYTNVERAIR
jgi:lipid II isoglutaminyl synthase (glutamine-hydrolysing)